MTGPRELVLHVGMGKTGTSTIQSFLRDHRGDLWQAGVLVPTTPGRARHAKVGLWAKDDDALRSSPEWPRLRAADPVRFRRRFRRRLLEEVQQSTVPRVLLTDEVLFMQPIDVLRRLRSLTDELAESTRLVVYLRRQDDHMVSRYQQGVKIGWVQRLADWSREDMSDLYDYAPRLRMHEEVLGPRSLVVRRYAPGRFVDGSLVADFLGACGIRIDIAGAETTTDRNVSLDADSVEFLRIWNLHRVQTEGVTPGQVDNRRIVSRLAEDSHGPTLSLPPEALRAWRGQWTQTNREVARRYFPEDGPDLFEETPSSRPTVTRQLLDPARVDQMSEHLDLPADTRRSLRRLAEREAATG